LPRQRAGPPGLTGIIRSASPAPAASYGHAVPRSAVVPGAPAPPAAISGPAAAQAVPRAGIRQATPQPLPPSAVTSGQYPANTPSLHRDRGFANADRRPGGSGVDGVAPAPNAPAPRPGMPGNAAGRPYSVPRYSPPVIPSPGPAPSSPQPVARAMPRWGGSSGTPPLAAPGTPMPTRGAYPAYQHAPSPASP